jgi:hypothetical protein
MVVKVCWMVVLKVAVLVPSGVVVKAVLMVGLALPTAVLKDVQTEN